MKILYLSPSVYEGTLKAFTKNKNGFALMVGSITKNMANKNEVYLLTHAITEETSIENVNVVKHKWQDILFSIKTKYVIEGIKNAFKYSMPLKGRMRYFFYSINKGYTKKIIKKIQPDIVNIHGIGYSTKSFIDVCEELGVKYIVSLHGLIGLDASVQTTQQDRELEKNFLIDSEKRNISCTVISSGIKKRIIENYGLKTGENINIVLNGTDTQKRNISKSNIISLYNIPTSNKIMLCIGNITKNKNQIQVVRAYQQLKKEIREKTTILFLGNEVDGGKLRAEIYKLKYENNLILCGFIEREKMSAYYMYASLNLFPSLNDGFGLPIIEGFVYGIPALAFSDIDAIGDLYSEDAMLLVEERNDIEFAEKMQMAMLKKWDNTKIKAYGNKFSFERMTEEYQRIFEKVIG